MQRVFLKKSGILIVFLAILHCSLYAQNAPTPAEDTISQRIVLIGDAGQLTDGWHPVVNAVKRLIPLDKKTTVLFLGDNLYKVGLPDEQYESYKTARAVLDSQLSVADGTPAKVYMIPGNHDWENGGRGGFDAIIRQQLYVDFLGKKNVKYYPEDGCPGPVEVNLGDDVTLILFDSQWWIHAYDKPEIESDCACKTKEELVTQIGDIAARNSKKLVVLACHHPFKSNGIHGGFFKLKQHIFPLTDIKPNLYVPMPIIGSIYPIARSVFGTPQDLKHPNYANMITQVSEAIKAAAPNIVFVSGHEHNLQHIKDSNYHYIVSGGGCKESRASKSKKSLFESPSFGFSVMEVSRNKNVTITFYTVLDTVKKAYTATLMNFATLPTAAIDSSTIRTVEDPFLKYKDTVTISASDDFPPVKGLKRFFMGQNYRYTWSAPVNMRVFNLRKEKGGMTILSLGGGKQTKSLRLRDNTGKEWVLRSMNKNPTKAIPEAFRGTIAEDLVTELNSASNPYAGLIIPSLAGPLDVAVPHPELFFVPDDPALGYYRPLFANNICMLEERHPSVDGTETRTTAKVFDKMLDENDHRPDQPVVLRARLLDILLADFDRHFDQWRWGTIDTGKGKIYYPIPRDRDQALFVSDGALLKVVSGRKMPFLKGFRNDIPNVKWLGYSARDFDRIFLTDLDAAEWRKGIQVMQTDLTDSVIRTAVHKLPPEVFSINGETIISKLINRRNLMLKEGMRYYRFISKYVNVVGSNQKEYFKVSNNGQGLQVRVYARSKGNDTSFIMYDRIFNPSVTKEIRLYGLNDDDIFDIEENAKSRIKIRIIGGKGNDTFDIRGNVENLLYDLKVEGNYIKNQSRSKNRFSNDPPVNERSLLGFNYNTTKFPQFAVGYNTDDALLLGTAFSYRTFGFRNPPYATDQRLSLLYAPDRRGFQARYRGEFNHITRNYDLVVHANFSTPTLRNFFGLGNNTTVDSRQRNPYYQTRYQSLEVDALLRRRYFDKLQLLAGPSFFQYDGRYKNNNSNVLAKPQDFNLDSADIFSKKTYFGGKLGIRLDNRNNELFPTRGVQWNNEFVYYRGIGTGSDNYSAVTSDMTVYASFNDPARLVAVLKIGGGHIFSKNFEYFQALNFGANNGLYGFRKNRYAGASTFYSGLEMRVKLFDIDSYILPGAFGVIGFYDIGRVWLKDERSKRWHGGYGGGLYFIPFNLFLISATAGFSENERALNFTLGTKINLTF